MIITKDNGGKIGLTEVEYKPSLLFRNHHVNTMFPYAVRKNKGVVFQRSKFETKDADFVHLDNIKRGSDTIVVLLHGLEGSSNSQYILGLTAALENLEYDICALNHRSCSGEMNVTLTMYHSGFIDDLIEIIEYLSNQYKFIHLVGYSLGGSMVLNYLGRHQSIPSTVKSALAFSVPIDLSSSALMLNHWKNKIYTIQFLSSLNKKILEKARQHPNELNENNYKDINTLIDYDNLVTAPLHGFVDAEDYYQKASSRPYLSNICKPTLLINAHDDSFLAPQCYPYEIADRNDNFHFLGTKYGGHVGFADFRHDRYWSDRVAIEWLQANQH